MGVSPHGTRWTLLSGWPLQGRERSPQGTRRREGYSSPGRTSLHLRAGEALLCLKEPERASQNGGPEAVKDP